MSERTTILLRVNGETREVEVEPRTTLADVLRMNLGLTGTRLGCEHGTCGACTVLVDGEPARSCLVLGVQAEGHAVETIECTGDVEDAVEEAFVRRRALQCGFCTSGFVMLARWLARQDPVPDEDEVRDVLASNLCRCTGYAPIEAAVADCLARAEGDREP